MFQHSVETLLEGVSMYGVSGLAGYVRGDVCCSIHRACRDVCEDADGVVGSVAGRLPAIAAANLGIQFGCHAEPVTLVRDKQFLAACTTLDHMGFQFRSQRTLSSVRRWETGTIVGMTAFGAGYCYLWLFRERFRMRIARILGPVPYLADVLLLFRLAGTHWSMASFRSVAPSVLHCEEQGRPRSGADLWEEMHGLLALDPFFRVGVSEEQSRRGYCPKCCFDVLLDGHDARCRVVRVREPEKELVGDALHALDVKIAVVNLLPGAKYTEVSKKYVSAGAQASYMRFVLGMQFSSDWSDHTVASVFESNYAGNFRNDYVFWMLSDCTGFHDWPLWLWDLHAEIVGYRLSSAASSISWVGLGWCFLLFTLGVAVGIVSDGYWF